MRARNCDPWLQIEPKENSNAGERFASAVPVLPPRRRRIPSASASTCPSTAGRGRAALQVDQHRQGLAPALVRHPRRRPHLLQDPTPLLRVRRRRRHPDHWARPIRPGPPRGPRAPQGQARSCLSRLLPNGNGTEIALQTSIQQKSQCQWEWDGLQKIKLCCPNNSIACQQLAYSASKMMQAACAAKNYIPGYAFPSMNKTSLFLRPSQSEGSCLQVPVVPLHNVIAFVN